MNHLAILKRKRNKLKSEQHKASFEQYGYCTLPGCKCFQRKPFSFNRVGKIYPPEKTNVIQMKKKKK